MSLETVEALTNVYRREMLSFLQYVRHAPPYTAPTERPLATRLVEMADSERNSIGGFVDFLDRSRITVPHVGGFPTVFTNYNFIAMRKMLPLLVTDQSTGLAALERDANNLPPGPARTEVEKLLALKKMHLTELEKAIAD